MVQGQSSRTREKQNGLKQVLDQWLSIVNNIYKKGGNGHWSSTKHPVLYVDMNAGSGWNEKVNCVGSPLIFLEAAEKYSFPKEIYFIEKDPDSAKSLMHRIAKESVLREDIIIAVNDDHDKVLPSIITGKSRYGLVYHDPNGVPNFDLLRRMCALPGFSKIDILIYISGCNYKRVRRGLDQFGTKRNQPQLVGKYPFLSEQLNAIDKKLWIVRDISESDGYQWTFLFGTNYENFKPWASRGFFDINSPKGREIFKRINLTEKEMDGDCFGQI